MARNSVKLSIYSTFDKTGTEQATAALEQFRKRYGAVTDDGARTTRTLDATTTALLAQSVAADQAALRCEKVSRTLGTLGATATMGLTVPIAATGYAAVRAASDMESSFALVRKTVDATEEQYRQLYESAIEMSKAHPVSAAQVAEIMSLGAQLGISTGNLRSFAEVAYGMDLATNLSADEASESLARFSNITRTGQEDIGRLGSVVVELGNHMATTESDIMNMAMRIASAGTTAGMSQANIFALAGTLSSLGMEAEAGGTAVSRTILQVNADIARNSDTVALWAQLAGTSVEDFTARWKAGGDSTTKVLADVMAGMAGVTDEGGNLTIMLDELGISGIRQTDALQRMALGNELLTESIDMANAAWSDNVALGNEVANFEDTFASRLEVLKNKLTDLAIEAGEPLLEMLTEAIEAGEPMLEFVRGLVEGFNAMDEGGQRAVVQFVALLAAIGPVSKLLSPMVGTVGKLTKAYSKWTAQIAKTHAQEVKEARQLAILAANEKDLAKQQALVTKANQLHERTSKATTASLKAQAVAQKALNVATSAGKALLGGIAFTAIAVGVERVAEGLAEAAEHQKLVNAALEPAADVVRRCEKATKDADKATADWQLHLVKGGKDFGTAFADVDAMLSRLAQSKSDLAATTTQIAVDTGTLAVYRDRIAELGGKADLTDAEMAELKACIEAVNEMCGTHFTVIGDENTAFSDQVAAIDLVIDAYKRKAEAEAYEKFYKQAVDDQVTATKTLHDTQQAYTDWADQNVPDMYRDCYDEMVANYDAETGLTTVSADHREQMGELLSHYPKLSEEVSNWGGKLNEAERAVETANDDMSYYAGKMGEVGTASSNTASDLKAYITDNMPNVARAVSDAGGDLDSFCTSLSNIGIDAKSMGGISEEVWTQIAAGNDYGEANVKRQLENAGAVLAITTGAAGQGMIDAYNNEVSNGTLDAPTTALFQTASDAIVAAKNGCGEYAGMTADEIWASFSAHLHQADPAGEVGEEMDGVGQAFASDTTATSNAGTWGAEVIGTAVARMTEGADAQPALDKVAGGFSSHESASRAASDAGAEVGGALSTGAADGVDMSPVLRETVIGLTDTAVASVVASASGAEIGGALGTGAAGAVDMDPTITAAATGLADTSVAETVAGNAGAEIGAAVGPGAAGAVDMSGTVTAAATGISDTEVAETMAGNAGAGIGAAVGPGAAGAVDMSGAVTAAATGIAETDAAETVAGNAGAEIGAAVGPGAAGAVDMTGAVTAASLGIAETDTAETMAGNAGAEIGAAVGPGAEGAVDMTGTLTSVSLGIAETEGPEAAAVTAGGVIGDGLVDGVDAAIAARSIVPTVEAKIGELSLSLPTTAYTSGYATGASYSDGVEDGMNAGKAALKAAATGAASAVSGAVDGTLDIHSPSGVGKSQGENYVAGIKSGLMQTVLLVAQTALMAGLVKKTAETGLSGSDAMGSGMTADIASGIRTGTPTAKAQASLLGTAVKQGAAGSLAGMWTVGLNAANGLAAGALSTSLAYVGARLGNQIIAGAKSALQVASPSKVMAEVGGYAAAGLVVGSEGSERDAYRAGGSLAAAYINGARAGRGSLQAGGGGLYGGGDVTVYCTVRAKDLADVRTVEDMMRRLDVEGAVAQKRAARQGRR